MTLPAAEPLIAALVTQLKPALTPDTKLIGIVTGGAWLAERLQRELGLQEHGALDISFYRDDVRAKGLKHEVKPSAIPFDIEGRDIILVDDVLHTGRTVRAAMNELFDYGRPKSIQLAVLIDRGGHELPIAAQFVGATLDAPSGQGFELKRDAEGGNAGALSFAYYKE